MKNGHPVLAMTIAAVAGVMVVANQVGHGGDLLSLTEYLAPKGVIYGFVAAIVVFLIARLLFTTVKARSWGYLSATIVTGLIGLQTLAWNVAWGVTPTSLEGAWLWPLAIVPLALSFISFRRWRQIRRAD
jgi:hypothetical protein